MSSRPVIVRFCLKNKSIQDVLYQEAAVLVRVAVGRPPEAWSCEGRSGSIRARRQLREDHTDAFDRGCVDLVFLPFAGDGVKASVCCTGACPYITQASAAEPSLRRPGVFCFTFGEELKLRPGKFLKQRLPVC